MKDPNNPIVLDIVFTLILIVYVTGYVYTTSRFYRDCSNRPQNIHILFPYSHDLGCWLGEEQR